ncbi:MAG: hypothetical protein M1828_006158 [Chrysothrix sp. TS-e1954]|nr:MAG: hypothetical protein M1828_006158 [Chrysothrix sp. TS-e1954]
MARGKRESEPTRSLFLAMQDADANSTPLHPPSAGSQTQNPRLSQNFVTTASNLNILRTPSSASSARVTTASNLNILRTPSSASSAQAKQLGRAPVHKPNPTATQHALSDRTNSRKPGRMDIQDPRGFQLVKQTSHLDREELTSSQPPSKNGPQRSQAFPTPVASSPMSTQMVPAQMSSALPKREDTTSKTPPNPRTLLSSKMRPDGVDETIQHSRRMPVIHLTGPRPCVELAVVRSTVKNERGSSPDDILDITAISQLDKHLNPFENHFESLMRLSRLRSHDEVKKDDAYHSTKMRRLQIISDVWAANRRAFIRLYGQPQMPMDVERVLGRLAHEVYHLQFKIQGSKGKYSSDDKRETLKQLRERFAWLGWVFEGHVPDGLLARIHPSLRKQQRNTREEPEETSLIDFSD